MALVVLPPSAFAADDSPADPFGAGSPPTVPSGDPFAREPAHADPFGDPPAADPFGAGADPFGDAPPVKPSAKKPATPDPFGAGPANDDPFGTGQANPDPFDSSSSLVRPADNSRRSRVGQIPLLVIPDDASEKMEPFFLDDAANVSLRAALDKPFNIRVIEESLANVVEVMEDAFQIQIEIDTRALDGVGIGSDTPITISSYGRSLRATLNRILHELELTWCIVDETLLITTEDAAEDYQSVRVYPVSDLTVDALGERPLTPIGPCLAGWSGLNRVLLTETSTPGLDRLIEVATTVIDPETWSEVGGPGEIQALRQNGADFLVVAQTEATHRKLEQLLRSLRAVLNTPPAGSPAVKQAEVDPQAPRWVVYRLSPPAAAEAEKLVRLVQVVVEPDSWSETDATVEAALESLIVKQRPAAQQKIRGLLESLDALQTTGSQESAGKR
ncbi:hypothetical protein Pla8534_04540 [Lignipirellula cremea]|uniref:Uncharacterized protein n=2 Tax=Lignipirellula cremea TaxID=2528010 RepID=A0A518DLK1_9BACT|nr:hypothetical protein Pla8534_04540 [Lignipirellula cremea]